MSPETRKHTRYVWKPQWLSIGLFSAALFYACNTTTAPDVNTPPTNTIRIIAPDSLSGTAGDTLTIRAYAQGDSLERPVVLTTRNATVATVHAETLVVLRQGGIGELNAVWTDGIRTITKTIKVTVAPSPYVTFRVTAGLIKSDSATDRTVLSATIAWRIPSKDSVTVSFNSAGIAEAQVPREIAEVMDSVTVSVVGSARHLPMSMNFRQSWTKKDFFTTNADFSTFVDEMKTSISVPHFRFVLAPIAYAPSVGISAGQSFAVSPLTLYTPDYQSTKGWMSGRPFTNSRLESWVDSLPVRLCKVETSAELTEADSVAFWGSANDSLNARTGKVWFVPAATNCRAYWTVNPNLSGMLGQMISHNGLPMVEFKNFPRNGDVYLLGSTIPHELFHVLGFGHVGGWTSVMSINGTRTASLVPMDNAMLHLFYELSLAEKAMGDAVSMEAARQYLFLKGQWPSEWTLAKASADENSTPSYAAAGQPTWTCH